MTRLKKGATWLKVLFRWQNGTIFTFLQSKAFICYKYQFLELPKYKNEWHHLKQHTKLAKKMVWFSTFGCVVPEIWRFENQKNCGLSIFSSFSCFSNLHISGTTHPNIANHTIFLASFVCSFKWCHSFFHLGNSKNWYL